MKEHDQLVGLIWNIWSCGVREMLAQIPLQGGCEGLSHERAWKQERPMQLTCSADQNVELQDINPRRSAELYKLTNARDIKYSSGVSLAFINTSFVQTRRATVIIGKIIKTMASAMISSFRSDILIEFQMGGRDKLEMEDHRVHGGARNPML